MLSEVSWLHKRYGQWKVAAILIAVVAAGSGIALGSHARAVDGASLQGQVLAVAAKLRVPSEHDTMTAANSPEPLAQHMRYQIQQDLLRGQSSAKILQEMQKQYGPGVLAAPANRGYGKLVWWLPALVLIALLALIGAFLRRPLKISPSISESSRDTESTGDTESDIQRRVHDYL